MEERFLGRKDFMTDVRRLQAVMGTLYAGGGVVKLSEDGIEILVTTSKEDKRSYHFVSALGGTATALWGSHITAGATPTNFASLWANEVAAKDTLISVKGAAPSGQEADARILASQNDDASYAGVYCRVTAPGVEQVETVVGGVAMIKSLAAANYAEVPARTAAGLDVQVMAADGKLVHVPSARAYKTDIRDHQTDRQAFMSLRPRTYRLVGGKPDAPAMVGLIAEEVVDAFPDFGVWAPCASVGPDEKPELPEPRLAAYDHRQVMATIVSVVQQQQRDIEALQERVAALEAGVG